MVLELVGEKRKYRIFATGSKITIGVLAFVLFLVPSSCTGSARDKLVQEAKEAIETADRFMGDWQGNFKASDGTESPLSAQVIALGRGKYQANLLTEFDKDITPMAVLQGQLTGATVHFTEPTKQVAKWQGAIEGGEFTGSSHGPKPGSFVMHKVFRPSPRLGAKPPAGAIVLFDGKNLDQWEAAVADDGVWVHRLSVPVERQWKLVNGAMEVTPRGGSLITKRKFNDVKLHLEFRTPFMPEARGQRRGNSGVFLQGRYEVQVLDSYGLKPAHDECGGIYSIEPPILNMCAPPMQWQSYDITFRAPRFDSTGKNTQDARSIVFLNGVKVQDNTKVPKPAPAALNRNVTEPAGIMLQNHGNPAQFRNIWLVELR